MKMHFWGETSLHAVYLTSLTGRKENLENTPYELLLGVKPNIEKLQIFGCAAYVQEPKEKLPWKLSIHGNPGILLVHQDGVYRV